MFKSILVVCTGNLCRSPIAERLLSQCLPELDVTSAGTCVTEGQPADKQAITVAARHGLSLEGHKARKLTTRLLRNSDLILVMEMCHIHFITALAPEMRGKSLLFGRWQEEREIPDPVGQYEQSFELVYHLLYQASQEWALRIRT